MALPTLVQIQLGPKKKFDKLDEKIVVFYSNLQEELSGIDDKTKTPFLSVSVEDSKKVNHKRPENWSFEEL